MRSGGGAGKFRRTREDFVCEWCGAKVRGTGYTDHCPACLASRHIDINPGDRASLCGGKMVPVGAIYKGGSVILTYRCLKCGFVHRVKAAQDDSPELIWQTIRKTNRRFSHPP